MVFRPLAPASQCSVNTDDQKLHISTCIYADLCAQDRQLGSSICCCRGFLRPLRLEASAPGITDELSSLRQCCACESTVYHRRRQAAAHRSLSAHSRLAVAVAIPLLPLTFLPCVCC